MARYIVLISLTPEGRENVLQDSNVILNAEEDIGARDARILGLYAVLGDIDFCGYYGRRRQRIDGALCAGSGSARRAADIHAARHIHSAGWAQAAASAAPKRRISTHRSPATISRRL